MALDDPWLLLRAWVIAPALVLLAASGTRPPGRAALRPRLRALTLPAGYVAGIAFTTVGLQLG